VQDKVWRALGLSSRHALARLLRKHGLAPALRGRARVGPLGSGGGPRRRASVAASARIVGQHLVEPGDEVGHVGGGALLLRTGTRVSGSNLNMACSWSVGVEGRGATAAPLRAARSPRGRRTRRCPGSRR
jgi:hypothetical protein